MFIVSRPALRGLEARTMVLAPGSVGQVSLRAITPPVLVMTRFCGARSGKTGGARGVTTWGWPNRSRVQLILLNNWAPVSGPLWPRRDWLRAFWAAATQAIRWLSVSARQAAETFLRLRRIFDCRFTLSVVFLRIHPGRLQEVWTFSGR